MKPPAKRNGPPPACSPAPYTDLDIQSIQAIAAGVASAGQQKRALDWIINSACGAYELSYRSGDPHETSFAEGRRFSGLQIVKMLRLRSKP